MAIVTLVSGGVDSILMAALTKESGVVQHPLFIDYGQIFVEREFNAAESLLRDHHLPKAKRMDVSGFGKLIPSGLTNKRKHIHKDAFLPNRNLLFLLCGASYAVTHDCTGVAIGLLNDCDHIFPDQTEYFLRNVEQLLSISLGRSMPILAPLMSMTKDDVLVAAASRGIHGWYSCHSGKSKRCGLCVSCKEAIAAENRLKDMEDE